MQRFLSHTVCSATFFFLCNFCKNKCFFCVQNVTVHLFRVVSKKLQKLSDIRVSIISLMDSFAPRTLLNCAALLWEIISPRYAHARATRARFYRVQGPPSWNWGSERIVLGENRPVLSTDFRRITKVTKME